MERVRSWFPDREFFMRSNGHVRFIRISAQLQMRVAGAVAGAVLLWVLMMGWMVISQAIAAYNQASLLEREAAVATAESRVAKYRSGLGSVASDLAKRQDFIEKSVQGAIGPLPRTLPSGTVSDSTEEAGKTVRKISMELPEVTGLAKVEARQLAFIETLTRYADARSARAEMAMRRLGLNPRAVAAADRGAMGGPLIPMATGSENKLDPRFARFGASLARMSAMEQALVRIPNTLPASLDYISSGFGYRVDPFTGGGAFHAGLDFRGPIGAPILAAAAGTVSFTGVKQGYGNCVEISHGNGLLTRYAHMSRIAAHVGEAVGPGRVIGAIGSTGRSTGPHLHFEVRIADRPVDPRPFLEAMPHVFQKASTGNGHGLPGGRAG
ncbi:peptidoglycan DD-metalloendopeptidase family protein [Novosphingobium sp.]|uniref:M23 family metallopeptidase n=1 Tax=Novosphingobium sp. TaxID=1874826 RepID=UPI003BA99550